jgi:hypothetical protein
MYYSLSPILESAPGGRNTYDLSRNVRRESSRYNCPIVFPAKAGIHRTSLALIQTMKYDHIPISLRSPASFVRYFSPNEAGESRVRGDS